MSGLPRVAIVDYGMGNLFSVKHACEHARMSATITSSWSELSAADAVVLPGVGAFGDAMENLRRLDLVGPLQEIASSSKPLVGICLGMQLLMTESDEFGKHAGLGVLKGSVVPFVFEDDLRTGPGGEPTRRLKVPHVGWSRVLRKTDGGQIPTDDSTTSRACDRSLMAGLPQGVRMYFVHSLYVLPEDAGTVTATSRYGDVEFCSGLAHGNVTAFQFHPERSGPDGLQIYRSLASALSEGP